MFRSSAIPALSRHRRRRSSSAIWVLGALRRARRGGRGNGSRLAADARAVAARSSTALCTTRSGASSAREGISTPTAIVASSHSIEPGVLGIRTPVLIWPRHLTAGLSDTHIEAIVAHEVCHIVRRDNLLASVQIVVSAVFWFHPLVWWIGARLVDERERACDERVLALGGVAGNLRRKHFGNVPAVYRIAASSTCPGVTGGDLEAAHRSHHEERTVASRWTRDGRRRALLAAAAAACALSADPRPDVEPRWPACDRTPIARSHEPGGRVDDAKADSRGEAAVHRARHAGESPGRGPDGMRRQGGWNSRRHEDRESRCIPISTRRRWMPPRSGCSSRARATASPSTVLVTIAMTFTLK